LDWDYVLWRSEIFRTTPLLFFHLRRLDLLEGVPEPVRFYLERWSTLSEVRAKLLYEELMPILDSFEHFGLDYFLLKGCAVSALLYPDPLVRPILDLDLMIDPEDIRIALEIMAGLGYVHGLWHSATNQITRVDYGPTDMSEHHELPVFLKRVHTKSPLPRQFVPKSWCSKHIKCFIGEDGTVSFPILVDLHLNLSVGFDL